MHLIYAIYSLAVWNIFKNKNGIISMIIFLLIIKLDLSPYVILFIRYIWTLHFINTFKIGRRACKQLEECVKAQSSKLLIKV